MKSHLVDRRPGRGSGPTAGAASSRVRMLCPWSSVLALAIVRCGGGPSLPAATDGGVAQDAPRTLDGAASTRDAGTDAARSGRDAGAPDSHADAAQPIVQFNGCAAGDYVERTGAREDRTIAIGADGLTFTPRCLAISVGQSVRFEGSLTAHPIAPGNPAEPAAGSPETPILGTSSGSSAEFTFQTPGTFPYYCELHSFGAGEGMAGVVHVRP